MGALLGLEAQGTAHYNYLVNGTVIPPGSPVSRDFVNHEGEIYAQDTWKATRNLTITAGLRLSLEPPVYEANGQQASTNIPLARGWATARLAAAGQSQAGAPLIQFIPYNGPGGRPMYPYHKNWAPRLGIAYSPKGDSGLSKFFFGGPGKSSIRAGAGMYYDLIGQPLAQSFSSSQFGLSSSLSKPGEHPEFRAGAAVHLVLYGPRRARAARASGRSAGDLSDQRPGLVRHHQQHRRQAEGALLDQPGFQYRPRVRQGILRPGFLRGRLSRHSLIQRDLAMPTDLVDPKSARTISRP